METMKMESDNNIFLELCFACLAKNPTEILTKEIYETYMNITLLELPEDVPKKLCNSCDRLLKEVNDFKSICTESYDCLMKMRQEQLTQNNKLTFHQTKKHKLNPNEDDIVLIVGEAIKKPKKDSKDTSNDKLLYYNDESESDDELNKESYIIESDNDDTEIYTVNSDTIDFFTNSNDNTRHKYIKYSEPKSESTELNEETDIKDSNSIVKSETDATDYVYDDIKIENEESHENSDFDDNDDDSDWTCEDYNIKTKNTETVQKASNNVSLIKKKEKAQDRKKVFVQSDFIIKNYDIKVLSREEQIADFNKRKYSDNYINCKFKCEKCYRGFKIEESYRNHMFSHTEKYGNMVCDICNAHVKHRVALYRHKARIHQRILSCKLCPYTTHCGMRARLHTDLHNNVKYECEYCGKIFARKGSIMSHKRIQHASEHVCVLCGYSFLGANGLECHLRLKHLDEEAPVDGPKCDECNLTFANEKVLATHIATSKIHGGTKINQQKYNKTCKKNVRSTRNTYEHGQDGQITCEQCDAVLPTDRMYRNHFYKYHSGSTITQGSYLCFICGKTFDTDHNLRCHLFSHDLGKTYKCDFCDLTFTTLRSYSNHRQEHKNKINLKCKDEKFCCKICGKLFSSNGNRRRHEIVFHTDIRNEKCDFCEKTFKTNNEKKIHTDHVHLKKPYKKRIRNKRIKKIDL